MRLILLGLFIALALGSAVEHIPDITFPADVRREIRFDGAVVKDRIYLDLESKLPIACNIAYIFIPGHYSRSVGSYKATRTTDLTDLYFAPMEAPEPYFDETWVQFMEENDYVVWRMDFGYRVLPGERTSVYLDLDYVAPMTPGTYNGAVQGFTLPDFPMVLPGFTVRTMELTIHAPSPQGRIIHLGEDPLAAAAATATAGAAGAKGKMSYIMNRNSDVAAAQQALGPIFKVEGSLFVEYSGPLLVAESWTRTFAPGMFDGHVRVTEHLELANLADLPMERDGGEFRRGHERQYTETVQSFVIHVPHGARNCDARDRTGRINTLDSRNVATKGELVVYTRYPLAGGMKTELDVDYDVPFTGPSEGGLLFQHEGKQEGVTTYHIFTPGMPETTPTIPARSFAAVFRLPAGVSTYKMMSAVRSHGHKTSTHRPWLSKKATPELTWLQAPFTGQAASLPLDISFDATDAQVREPQTLVTYACMGISVAAFAALAVARGSKNTVKADTTETEAEVEAEVEAEAKAN